MQQPCDDRFHTPRASASSSRSQNSNASSFATPRETLMSARSMSSSDSESIGRYRTPRTTFRSPVEGPISGNQPYGLYRGGGHDRSRDFRRFTDRAYRPASASIMNSTYHSHGDSYTLPGQPPSTAAASTNRQRDYELAERGTLPKSKPNLNIFSLARHGRHRELEDLLLRGIPVDTMDENGNQIIHIGSQNGKKKILRIALQYGADINSVNNSGNSALHFAMKYGFGRTLGNYLISKGANAHLRNNEGRLCSEV